MCHFEIIDRLLTLISKSIPMITDQATLESILSELDHIKTCIDRKGIDTSA
jgi:hypothetical protein